LKRQLILSYQEFFNQKPPENRLELLNGVSKNEIIHQIASLNTRLKPPGHVSYDLSLKTQLEELKYFSGFNEELSKRNYLAYRRFFKDEKTYAIIFNRAANLVALEELINSSLPDPPDFNMTEASWDSILRYYLAINTAIVEFKETPPGTSIENFEHVHAALVPLNEYSVPVDPIFLPFRGQRLFRYFLTHTKYGKHIQDYFDKTLETEPDYFIFMMLEIYLRKRDDPKFNYLFRIPPEKIKFYNSLSIRSIKPSNNILECLSIKKSPFYHYQSEFYVLTDDVLSLEKCYDSFLNDIWFDKLKKAFPGSNDFGNYRSELVGPFLENYSEELIRWSFHFLHYPEPKCYSDLKITTGSGEIELADIYIRQNKKILIGQAKSKGIYSKEKYSGSHEFFKDKEEFYKEVGIDQLIISLNYLHDSPELYEKEIKDIKKLDVFPILIVNDKTFQTGLSNNIINQRYQEKLSKKTYPKFTLHPVTVVHISDLERMSQYIHERSVQIWDLLRCHYEDKAMLNPFYITLNRCLNGRKYPKHVLEEYRALIKKYNPEGAEN